jgi:hypothetical protein
LEKKKVISPVATQGGEIYAGGPPQVDRRRRRWTGGRRSPRLRLYALAAPIRVELPFFP